MVIHHLYKKSSLFLLMYFRVEKEFTVLTNVLPSRKKSSLFLLMYFQVEKEFTVLTNVLPSRKKSSLFLLMYFQVEKIQKATALKTL